MQGLLRHFRADFERTCASAAARSPRASSSRCRRITVDGVGLEVAEGARSSRRSTTLGLLMNGVDVPHYCWHPKLSIDGSCRLCQVEIEGMPKLQIACNTPVKDGMVVRTQSERVRSARARA